MQVKLAMEVLEMTVTIDESWQHGFPPDLDQLSIRRDGNFPALAYRLESPGANNDDGVFDGRTARSVDQFSTRTTNALSAMITPRS
jgi:hypothetical protein